MISIYEKNIVRFMFGGIQENETWRRRSNLKLYQSYKESDIVNFTKIRRIKWADQVIRMNEDRTIEKVFDAQPISARKRGRPNLRWIEGLEKIS
ncbi:uncharacterized protein TNCV_2155121 [Trichonephila clavipes]|nr:uncharacterized protein TNCV_2155121 [Trichonephila clavipes]